MALDHAWRGSAAERPQGFPVPPDGALPLLRRRRLRKQWRYVGLYRDDVMLCAGEAIIGPAHQHWWALWDRVEGQLHERTRQFRGRGRIFVGQREVRVRDERVVIELDLVPGEGVETITPDPGGWAWTSKHVDRARGTVQVGGRSLRIDGPVLVDESAGYHPRHTSWRWSAGLGTMLDGRAAAWNLVDGVHDTPGASERTVWVDGEPTELGPVVFAAELAGVTFDEGGDLRFEAESTRAREHNLLLFRSSYEQPFGRFTGELPHAGALAEGFGVMERHDVVW